MKKVTPIALLCLLLPLQAYAANDEFCSPVSSSLAKRYHGTRTEMDCGSVNEIKNMSEYKPKFLSVAKRLCNKTNMLLESSLTKPEMQADLYSLCMSIAD